jgi:hypothetical protein
MTKTQRKAITFLTLQFGMLELYDSPNGIIVAKHPKGVESIGTRGGITRHLHIFNNKFYKNDCWAYK